jgi:23S rRNA (adenine2503-C2)-methyltransferase
VSTDPAGLLGLSLAELQAGLGSRRAALALKRRVHATGALPTPQEIPDLSRDGRHWLRDRRLPEWELVAREVSGDGTLKLALRLGDASVETVLIPGRGRTTVCLSSQAGCSRACRFCATARLGFSRALSASEIVLQYVIARSLSREPPRNVVFMGMGEPMDNLDHVLQAIVHLTEPPLPGLAEGHVTVSTSGVVPGMRRFLREGRGNLALSLSATTDAERVPLVPHGKRWPIAAVLDALREGAPLRRGRRYFIEYVLLEGVNDRVEDAERLVLLLEGLPARVNLIPHNPFPGSDLRAPTHAAVARFQSIVREGGLRCLLRKPAGADIAAACGQLALLAPATGGGGASVSGKRS